MSALILASASPRRRELLDQLGVPCRVEPARFDETPLPGEAAGHYAKRIARGKAAAVVAANPTVDLPVLAADTTVVLDGEILGKPRDPEEALAMLLRLSGREHRVITAVCLWEESGSETVSVETTVRLLPLDRDVCAAYVATGEPLDKAGAYGIQGLGGALVSAIDGSYSNVVGLPLSETWQLLRRHGIDTVLERQGVGGRA